MLISCWLITTSLGIFVYMFIHTKKWCCKQLCKGVHKCVHLEWEVLHGLGSQKIVTYPNKEKCIANAQIIILWILAMHTEWLIEKLLAITTFVSTKRIHQYFVNKKEAKVMNKLFSVSAFNSGIFADSIVEIREGIYVIILNKLKKRWHRGRVHSERISYH